MAYSFQIDSVTVKFPIAFDWEERFTPFDDLAGRHVTSIFFTAVARFNAMQTSEFSAWIAACDGAAHSVTIPIPTDPETNATYTGVKLFYLGATIRNGIYFYENSFRLTRINPFSVPLFGAVSTS